MPESAVAGVVWTGRRVRRLFFGIGLLLISGGAALATDMDTVEQRIIADVMATLPTDSTVQTRMNTLGADGRWSTLTYNTTTTTIHASSVHAGHRKGL
jgi:hypothetical protein